MNYLLDTCVLSECVKKTPDANVMEWFNLQQSENLFISAITIAEIKKGMWKIKISQPARFQALQKWLQKIEAKFCFRILPVTTEVLHDWSEITAEAELKGKKMAIMDGLIAATAFHHRLTVVTRNVEDFEIAPVKVINPYD